MAILHMAFASRYPLWQCSVIPRRSWTGEPQEHHRLSPPLGEHVGEVPKSEVQDANQ